MTGKGSDELPPISESAPAPPRRRRGRPEKERDWHRSLELHFCYPPPSPGSREILLVCAAGEDLLVVGALSPWIPAAADELTGGADRPRPRLPGLHERYLSARDGADRGVEPLVQALAQATDDSPMEEWLVEACWEFVIAYFASVDDRPGQVSAGYSAIDGAVLLRIAQHLDEEWAKVFAEAALAHRRHKREVLSALTVAYGQGRLSASPEQLLAAWGLPQPPPKAPDGSTRRAPARRRWADPTFDAAFAACGVDPKWPGTPKNRLRRIWRDDLVPPIAADGDETAEAAPRDAELRKLERLAPSSRTNRWTKAWSLLSRIKDERREAVRTRVAAHLGVTWKHCHHFVSRLPEPDRTASARRLATAIGVPEDR